MADNSEPSRVSATLPGVDDAVGVPGAKGQAEKGSWYVAIVNPRHEKSVARKLDEAGIENFVAIQRELHLWQNGRKRTVDRVVIPSIVFIRTTEQERLRLVTLPYILRFMVDRAATAPDGLRRPAATIPDIQMQRLRFMLGQIDSPVEFRPTPYRVNDTVRVIRGQLKGLEGSVMQNSDGTHTLLVGLSILGGAAVRIDPTDVEKIR